MACSVFLTVMYVFLGVCYAGSAIFTMVSLIMICNRESEKRQALRKIMKEPNAEDKIEQVLALCVYDCLTVSGLFRSRPNCPMSNNDVFLRYVKMWLKGEIGGILDEKYNKRGKSARKAEEALQGKTYYEATSMGMGDLVYNTCHESFDKEGKCIEEQLRVKIRHA